jgi:hypothetical protein
VFSFFHLSEGGIEKAAEVSLHEVVVIADRMPLTPFGSGNALFYGGLCHGLTADQTYRTKRFLTAA